MPLRLLELFMPKANSKNVKEMLEEESVAAYWEEETSNDGFLLKILLSVEQTEKILDQLEDRYGEREGFRVILLPVEATIPRIQEEDEADDEEEEADASSNTEAAADEEDEEEKNNVQRVSREELYTDIVDNISLTRSYLALVFLSAIVAAVGLLRDNVAVVIGAMVIAPLLGPNVGLALATTLGDFKLGRDALKTNLVGLVIALALSILVGLTFGVDPTVPEISTRTRVFVSDIVVALASGSAGVLAFTSGLGTALIGVMVAVALLPPLVAFGLLLGAGYYPEAVGAFLLVVTNLICVNLAGVSTFLAQGIRPRKWWEANKAERATRWALALWSGLLVILAIVIILSQG